MFVIDKHNQISLTKGDTATMKVEVFDLDNKPYTIKDTDTIKMTVKKSVSATAVITKTATADHFIILNPSDTSSLNAGLYVYDVQLTTADGAIYTIVPLSYLELSAEVTNV